MEQTLSLWDEAQVFPLWWRLGGVLALFFVVAVYVKSCVPSLNPGFSRCVAVLPAELAMLSVCGLFNAQNGKYVCCILGSTCMLRHDHNYMSVYMPCIYVCAEIVIKATCMFVVWLATFKVRWICFWKQKKTGFLVIKLDHLLALLP